VPSSFVVGGVQLSVVVPSADETPLRLSPSPVAGGVTATGGASATGGATAAGGGDAAGGAAATGAGSLSPPHAASAALISTAANRGLLLRVLPRAIARSRLLSSIRYPPY
jgi:hypothetical protein